MGNKRNIRPYLKRTEGPALPKWEALDALEKLTQILEGTGHVPRCCDIAQNIPSAGAAALVAQSMINDINVPDADGVSACARCGCSLPSGNYWIVAQQQHSLSFVGKPTPEGLAHWLTDAKLVQAMRDDLSLFPGLWKPSPSEDIWVGGLNSALADMMAAIRLGLRQKQRCLYNALGAFLWLQSEKPEHDSGYMWRIRFKLTALASSWLVIR